METAEKARAAELALLSPEQLAAFLGVGRSFAYKLLADGSIPSVKLGRLRRVRRQDAYRFVERLAKSQGFEPVVEDETPE